MQRLKSEESYCTLLQSVQTAMQGMVRENAELEGALRSAKQDLVQERAQLCQVTAERVETEQKLRVGVGFARY